MKLPIQVPMQRGEYAAWGLGLAIFKYAVEALVVSATGGKFYSPIAFLLPLFSVKADALQGSPGWVGIFILAWSLPFVLVALSFTVRRCIDAGMSPWTAFWILCPFVNLLVMVGLCVVPSVPNPIRVGGEIEFPTSFSAGTAAVFSIVLGLLPGAAMLVLGVYIFSDYGAGIFFVTPVLMAAISSYSFQRWTRGSLAACLGVGLLCVSVSLSVMLLVALEGLICILMASPLVIGSGAIGAVIGYAIAESQGIHSRNWTPGVILLPIVAILESMIATPTPREVVSFVDIGAPVEVTWPAVIEFPPIQEPPQGWFRLGVACPLSARIEGTGVGATRYCEFSTGAFVEPITLWDSPHRLGFDVASQPSPMRELSPFGDIHPPHLDGFLSSLRGEFRLTELPGGRTRLEGRTWYIVDMYPQAYWQIWSDQIIHAIHLRVLNHIRANVE